MNIARRTLTLSKEGVEQSRDERLIDVGVFDVLLPGRFFNVAHKVAELGRVSMTTEYLLRLLRSVDGMEEEQVRDFFGFDRREMRFVLAQAETNDYVHRREGKLWLTATGRGLFRDGSEEPQVFDIEKRTDRVGLDLLALAPLEKEFLTRFDLSLPELAPDDPADVADASKRVPEAFRRHYPEIASRRDKEALRKRTLYSIDDVLPGDRFSSCIRVIARSSVTRADFPEPDVSSWKPEVELEDRGSVIHSIGKYVSSLYGQSAGSHADAYDVLLEIAPEYFSEFIRKDGLAVDRYYRDSVERAGEFRIDRPTVPLVGPVFARENLERLRRALDYALQAHNPDPDACVWIVPDLVWGTTRVLPAALDLIRRRLKQDEAESFSMIAVARNRERHLAEAFSIVDTGVSGLPASLEMLYIPGLLVAALVHAPIRVPTAFPVPLGLMSFDQRVLKRANTFLAKRLLARNDGPNYGVILAGSEPRSDMT
jgi:hypothetical protein